MRRTSSVRLTARGEFILSLSKDAPCIWTFFRNLPKNRLLSVCEQTPGALRHVKSVSPSGGKVYPPSAAPEATRGKGEGAFSIGYKKGGSRGVVRTIFAAPPEQPSIPFFGCAVPALEHQGHDQTDDEGGLQQPKERLDTPLMHDDEGTHAQADGHGGYGKDHLFVGKTEEEEPVVQVIFVDTGQKFKKALGLAVFDSRQVDVDHIEDKHAKYQDRCG